jgi:hypothetical protein
MARVIIRIQGFGSQYDDDEKTVSNVSIYSEASGIADGNPTGSSTEIQPYAQGDGGQGSTYTALVVPGYGDSGARFIRLTDGEDNTLLVKGIPEMQAGHSYTFNLVVGKNRIEVASVTVQDWTTGEILTGGQAEEVSASNVSTLAAAFVDGAVITVNFKWRGANFGDYVQGTYNASYGSFEADKGGDYWSSDERAVYGVVKNGDNITISVGFYDYEYEGMQWTFNTANDTYTYTPGLSVNEEPNEYGLISVTLNGIDITDKLTKQ